MNGVRPWETFLNQPVIPRGSSTVLDHLSPAAVAAASEALIQVDVVDGAERIGGNDVFYEVRVSKTLFAHRPVPSTLIVMTGGNLRIPAGRYLMALTATRASNPFHNSAPYRLTRFVAGIGEITSDIVTFRKWNGPDDHYAVSDARSWVGCFYHVPAAKCRADLLAHVRIRSFAERRTYEQLLAREPLAALMWAEVAKTTSRPFPTTLCSPSVLENCASLATFERWSDFHQTD